MNKIYKVIYNRKTNSRVVVSELNSRAPGGASSEAISEALSPSFSKIISSAAVIVLSAFSSDAFSGALDGGQLGCDPRPYTGVAIGPGSVSGIGSGCNGIGNGVDPVAVGANSTASANYDTAVGSNAIAGAPSANDQFNSAFGTNSLATSGGTAIGSQATSTGAQSVAIGSFSTDGGNANVVSVGNSTIQRRIINVAPGITSTDTVNVSQLLSLSTSTLTGIGSLSTGMSTTNSNVASLSTGLIATNSNVVSLSTGLSTANSNVASLSTGLTNALQYDDLTHSTVTLGGVGATTPVRLTNVAAGANPTDAVNVSQLQSLSTSTSTGLSAANSNVASLSTGLSTTNSNVASLSTGLIATNSNVASLSTGLIATNSNVTSLSTGLSTTNSNVTSLSTSMTNLSTTVNNLNVGSTFNKTNDPNAVAAQASGAGAVASGGGAVASGDTSVALGKNATAAGINSVAIGASSVANEPNTVSFGSVGKERRLANVAPGVDGTDAVNLGQLNGAVASGVSQANNYTDQRIADTNRTINDVAKNAYSGVAAALAMPNLTPSAPGHTVAGVGIGSYKSGRAMAVSVTHRSENGKWLMNGGVAVTSSGDAGVRAQVGYEW
ncbi:YadA family autotransporter adhesin [Burkholderia ubonensis]|uniref:YadA family autotransporter adhesin n=1 Tax=Burkholderia ubonensis TaxID=101571 RepID=UPI000B01E6EF|nr:YadA-like family protein [Burkholderia ubonensis]